MKLKIFCHCSFFLPGRAKDLSAPAYNPMRLTLLLLLFIIIIIIITVIGLYIYE